MRLVVIDSFAGSLLAGALLRHPHPAHRIHGRIRRWRGNEPGDLARE